MMNMTTGSAELGMATSSNDIKDLEATFAPREKASPSEQRLWSIFTEQMTHLYQKDTNHCKNPNEAAMIALLYLTCCKRAVDSVLNKKFKSKSHSEAGLKILTPFIMKLMTSAVDNTAQQALAKDPNTTDDIDQTPDSYFNEVDAVNQKATWAHDAHLESWMLDTIFESLTVNQNLQEETDRVLQASNELSDLISSFHSDWEAELGPIWGPNEAGSHQVISSVDDFLTHPSLRVVRQQTEEKIGADSVQNNKPAELVEISIGAADHPVWVDNLDWAEEDDNPIVPHDLSSEEISWAKAHSDCWKMIQWYLALD